MTTLETAARPQLAGEGWPTVDVAGNRILVVDDDGNLRTLLKLALRASGFEVMTATDGREALALVRLLRPDALVLDIMMPYLDGFQVVQQLRTENLMPATLFLTARDSQEDRGLAAALGAQYLTKPFRLTELIDRVKGLVS